MCERACLREYAGCDSAAIARVKVCLTECTVSCEREYIRACVSVDEKVCRCV